MPRSRVSLPIVALGRPQEPRVLKPKNQQALNDWFRVEANANEGTTHVYIYDEIGGWFGVWASELIDQIKTVDTASITVHINSPGGDAFDSVAIYNALLAHKAKILVEVDALAASGASIIAQAGDTVTMNKGSMMMIHDAKAGTRGNAEDHRFTADILDKLSNSIASIYAARAGGEDNTWREVMKAEAWYTAQEAVDAGLADQVSEKQAADAPTNNWDLSGYKYAGREAAMSPAALMEKITKEASVAGKANAPKNSDDQQGQQQAPPADPPAEDDDTQQGGDGGTETPPEGGDGGTETPPEGGEGTPQNKANFSVRVDGVTVNDPKKVQAHIDLLEGFRNDTKKAARTTFVEKLAADKKIPASNIKQLSDYAASLSDDGFEAWSKTWDDAPAHQGLATNVTGGTTNPDGDETPKSALDQQLETAAAIVDQHKKARMPQNQLEKTPSYQLLKTHNRI